METQNRNELKRGCTVALLEIVLQVGLGYLLFKQMKPAGFGSWMKWLFAWTIGGVLLTLVIRKTLLRKGVRQSETPVEQQPD
jgi:hypothetical protein